MLDADTVSKLYAADVSAQDKGRETDIPLITRRGAPITDSYGGQDG